MLLSFLSAALKDVIPNISIEAMTDGIELKWQDPTNPNGVILTYEIEYVADQMDQVILRSKFRYVINAFQNARSCL